MKVLIPQDVNQVGKEYLLERGYEIDTGSGIDIKALICDIADADAVLARTAPYPKEVIQAGKQLKIIARYGVGTDNIDVQYAQEQGVYVTVARGANTVSVAEHTIGLMLACAKNLLYMDECTRSGQYDMRNKLPGVELQGKTLGIIGMGSIGREVAAAARFGLGMKILGVASSKKKDVPEYIQMKGEIDDVLKESDVISLHVPLKPETRNLISKQSIEKMKKNAILINCARGGVVNEEDLYLALKEKRILAAAADVFDKEPPQTNNKLFRLKNFICSPHNAALTEEADRAMSLSCAKAIDDVLSGRKPEFPITNI